MEVSNESNIGSIKHKLGMGKITIEVDNIYNSGGVNELKIPLVYSNGNRQKNKGMVTLRLHVDLVDETGSKYPQRVPIQAQQMLVKDLEPQQVDTAKAVRSDDPLITEPSNSNINFRFKIDSLRAFQLVDTGNLLDKQDPSITITLGSKIFQTARSNSTKFVF